MTCELHTQTWATCVACQTRHLDCAKCGCMHMPETACPASGADAIRMQAQAIRDVYNSPAKLGEPLQGTQARAWCKCGLLATRVVGSEAMCELCVFNPRPATPCCDLNRAGHHCDCVPCPKCVAQGRVVTTHPPAYSSATERCASTGEMRLEVAPRERGWMCPRCHTVNAPYIRSCECKG